MILEEQKILNLKHAWEFILDSDVAQADTDYYLLCHIDGNYVGEDIEVISVF